MSRIASILPRIGWGEYGIYEGPWFKGSIPFELTCDKPEFLDKVLAVITATEGGAYDAINMYDRCVLTVGVIQWGEACANRAVSRMLGVCHEIDPDLLQAHLNEAGLSMRASGNSGWLVTRNGRADMHYVFMDGSSGLRGQWSDRQEQHARTVAAVMAGIWRVPAFREAQLRFTRPKLLDFARPFGAGPASLFVPGFPEAGWEGALRAGYLSFAANLPAVASRRVTAKTLSDDPREACIDLLRRLTFEPKVAIYPHRYNMIRPVLETEFGVDLPDFAEELRHWRAEIGDTVVKGDVRSIQNALSDLGFDLGPHGVDGRFGQKTRLAVQRFQRSQGLDTDGIVGPKTLAALSKTWELL